MTAMIERNPRQGVELRTVLDVLRFLASSALCVAAVAGFWLLMVYAFTGGAW